MTRLSIIGLSLFVTAALATASARAAAPEAYRAEVTARADTLIPDQFADPAAWIAQGTRYTVIAQAAAVRAFQWEWSGDPAYARAARELLEAILDAPPPGDLNEFFAPFPIMTAFEILADSGQATGTLPARVEAFADGHFRTSFHVADHNQALTMAGGLARAAVRFPSAGRADDWHAYAEQVWAAWHDAARDITENSPNYYYFDLIHAWVLADALGYTDLMTNPSVRGMFERTAAQVSPGGVLPAYGDSGTPTGDPDWPMEHPFAGYVSVFERAAAEYDLSHLREVADRLFETGRLRQPLDDRYTDISELFFLSLAPAWADPGLDPETRPGDVALLTRREQLGDRAPDKLLLSRPQTDAPFVLMDLYNRRSHAHENQHGAVNYFESHGAQLQTILGYNNRNPEHAAIVMLRPPGDPFPHRNPLYGLDQWESARLPTCRIPALDPVQPHRKRIDKLLLRVEHTADVSLTADNMRLTGPGGTQPIELFETASGWSKPGATVTDRTEGAAAVRFDVASGVIFIEKGGYGIEFDDRDWTHIELDWKLTAYSTARPIILRINAGADNEWSWSAAMEHLAPQLLDAWVARRGGDACGLVRYDGWFTPQTQLTRRLVLTAEDILVVCDDLAPGPAADGRLAGPIWHLPATAAPTAGPNWFDSNGGSHELLVWFATAANRSFGWQATDVWSIDDQPTAFARQTLWADTPVRFVSVLWPHAGATEPGIFAGGISSTDQAGTTAVELDHRNLRVEFGPGEAWRVRRHGRPADSRWHYRRTWRVTGYPPAAAPLTTHTLPVRLTRELFDYDALACAGRELDIRFLDDAERQLAHEVESWNPYGESIVWVQLPQVRDATSFHMEWRNNEGGTDAFGAPWPAFSAVYHLNRNLFEAGGQQAAGVCHSAADATGALGGGYGFDGDEAIELPAPLISSERGSIACWFRTDHAYATDPGVMIYGRGPGGLAGLGNGWGEQNEIHLAIRAGGELDFFIHGTPGVSIRTSAPVNDGQWHHAAATWEAGGDAVLYLDGEEAARATHNAAAFAADIATWLGRPESASRYFVGELDEVRFAPAVWTAGQVALDHAAQQPQGTLLQAGAVQFLTTSAGLWKVYDGSP